MTSGNDVQVGFGAGANTDGILAEFANLKAKASIGSATRTRSSSL